MGALSKGAERKGAGAVAAAPQTQFSSAFPVLMSAQQKGAIHDRTSISRIYERSAAADFAAGGACAVSRSHRFLCEARRGLEIVRHFHPRTRSQLCRFRVRTAPSFT